MYSIRYNPKCNPIENYFNQLKHYIKLKSPITYEEIVNSIKEINKHNVKKEYLENYFKYLFIQGKEFVKKILKCPIYLKIGVIQTFNEQIFIDFLLFIVNIIY